MALVRSPVYTITFTIQDRDLNTSNLTTYALTANTIAELTADVDLRYIPAIQGMSNGVITRVTYSTTYEEDSNVLAPEESDVQRKGLFSYKAANGATYSIHIPSLRNTLVVDRTNVIDVSAGAGQTFNNLILDGGFVTRPVTYLGSDIRALLKAEKRHRGSTSG